MQLLFFLSINVCVLIFLPSRLVSMVWPKHAGERLCWLQPQERSFPCSLNLCMSLLPVLASSVWWWTIRSLLAISQGNGRLSNLTVGSFMVCACMFGVPLKTKNRTWLEFSFQGSPDKGSSLPSIVGLKAMLLNFLRHQHV